MITEEEQEKLEHIINHVSDYFNNISEWEQKFMTDIRNKYERYTLNLRLSPKQWAVLEKIDEKCEKK
jgi:hypothetical protein